jgi:hypothetical protein
MLRSLVRPAIVALTVLLGLLLFVPSADAVTATRAAKPPSSCTIVPETFGDGNVGARKTSSPTAAYPLHLNAGLW